MSEAPQKEKIKFVPGYNQRFLQEENWNENYVAGPEGKEAGKGKNPTRKEKLTGPQVFLDECTYGVDLETLYKMHLTKYTCSYNEQMEYTPIQLQVQEQIKDLHGGANTNYLLQVWHQGRKIMQERLNQEVKQWAVCFDYFIYKTVDPDEQSRYFQMYDLKKPECLTLIEDFLRDESYGHFVFNNNKFYAANSTCIKIAFVKPSNQEYTTVKRKIDPKNIATIQLGSAEGKVHGMGLTLDGYVSENTANKHDFVHVFLEVAKDNKISSNMLEVSTASLPPYRFEYKLVEFREYTPRSNERHQDDPIQQYRFVFDKNGVHAAVALRRSKQFDIYHNGNWIDDGFNHKNGQYHKVKDFIMTYDRIMFQNQNGKRFIVLNHNQLFVNRTPLKVDNPKSLYSTERIKNSVRLYSGIILIETNVFVAHGRIVSQFYLKSQNFYLRQDCNFVFDSYVKQVFKRQKVNPVTKEKTFSVGVLLENGDIHVIDAEEPSYYRSWKINTSFSDIRIPGEVFSFYNDPVQFKCNLFLALQAKVDPEDMEKPLQLGDLPKMISAVSGRPSVHSKKVQTLSLREQKDIKTEVRAYIFSSELYDITAQLVGLNVTPQDGDSIVGLYEQVGEVPHFLYYRKQQEKVVLFKAFFNEASGEKKSRKAEREHKQLMKGQDGKNSAHVIIERIDQFPLVPREQISQTFDEHFDKGRKVWDDCDPKQFCITSAVIRDNVLLIFTKINCYQIRHNPSGIFNRNHIRVIPEISWKASFVAGMKHCYLIKDSTDRAETGLCYFDLARFLDDSKEFGRPYVDHKMHLQFAQVGIQSVLDYGIKIERLAYLQSYSKVALIPSLHLNQVTLIGQNDINNYVAIRQKNDAFYAISNEKDPASDDQVVTKLITWDILTGKKMYQMKISQDYREYERFKTSDTDMFMTGLYKTTLIVSKKPTQDESMVEQYFAPSQLKQRFAHQVPYVMSPNDEKEFHTFKMIEIKESYKVVELYQFEHPRYAEQQYLYFNVKGDIMIEWLSHNRVYLYEKSVIGKDKHNVPLVRWALRRKMVHMNKQYGRNDFLEIVSPDFTKFVDVDTSLKRDRFMIRDMLTEQKIHEIPHYLMNYEETPEEILLKFKWVGNDMIKLINREGVEKLVDIGLNFRQENFNTIQNYNYEEERVRHYYYDRKALKPSEITERLVRKTQVYKSAHFLSKSEHPHQNFNMYDKIFTIDFQAALLYTKKYFTDLSFSYINWRMIEQLKDKNKNNKLELSDLEDETIKQLCFTILPGGRTIFHELFGELDMITGLFEKALLDPKDVRSLKYAIPYLESSNRECPISKCIEAEKIKELNAFLGYLQGYGPDHHSRNIARFLPFILEMDPGNLGDYLDSRNQQTKALVHYARETLNPENQTPGIMVADIWTQAKNTKKTLFTDDKQKGKGEDVKVQYMDLAQIHEFSDVGQDFFEKLQSSDNFALFDQEIIRKLILFKWPVVKEHIETYLMYPYILYVLTVSFYTSNLIHIRVRQDAGEPDDYWLAELVLEELMAIFSLYFMGLEFLQVKADGLANYVSSIWNLIDVIPPALILMIYILQSNGRLTDFGDANASNREIYSTLMSIATLCLWMKSLYFFRIQESTGFLVRAILSVISEMKFFLLILLVTMFAFGDAFKVMSVTNDEDHEFIPGGIIGSVFYTYLLGLGEFQLDNFGQVGASYCKILWTANSVFSTIIMLNLFIAIICDTFARIQAEGKRASFREKAGLIAESQFLLSYDTKMNWCEKGKYLLYAQERNVEEEEAAPEYKTKLIVEESEHRISQMLEQTQTHLLKKITNMQKEMKQQTKESAEAEKRTAETLKEYINNSMTENITLAMIEANARRDAEKEQEEAGAETGNRGGIIGRMATKGLNKGRNLVN